MKRSLILMAAVAVGACTGERPLPDPVALSDSASNPTVGVGADGSTFAAWVSGSDGGGWNVFAAAPGRAAVRVNDQAGDAAPHEQAPAQVAVGHQGQIYVLWHNNQRVEGWRFPASDLRFARSLDGGATFEPAIFVNEDAGGDPTSHTFENLHVARDGTVYASWIDSRRRPPALVDEHAGHGEDGGAPEGPDIRVARSLDGGVSFEASVVVDSAACPCCRTAMATAPDGTLFVTWRKHFGNDVRDIVVAASRDGGRSFGEPVRVHEDGWVYPGCPHSGPSIAVDDEGVLYAAWFTGTEERRGTWYAWSADGGRSFSEPVRLTGNDPIPTSQVKIASAGSGVWVAWDDRAPENPEIVLERRQRGRRVESLRLGTGRSPAIAAHGGVTAVGWLDGTTANVIRLVAEGM